MTYPNDAMIAAIDALEEYALSAADIDALSADLPGEYCARIEALAEEQEARAQAPSDAAYRRQMREAGRGHLLRG